MNQAVAVKDNQVIQEMNVTPMALLQMAMQKGVDTAQLEKLMGLQERWEATQARKAFVVALNAFKADPPEVLKGKKVAFGATSYMHATLDDVSSAVGAALSKHGLSHRWDVKQDGQTISVSCILTHAMGHSESVQMQGSPDTSGSKNAIQAVGSTVTYLERYTLFAVTGIAAKDQDDDGGSIGQKLPDNQFETFARRIQEQTKKPAAKKIWEEAVKVCSDLKDLESAGKLKAVLLEHAKFIDNADKQP